jgi:hypothetical protein
LKSTAEEFWILNATTAGGGLQNHAQLWMAWRDRREGNETAEEMPECRLFLSSTCNLQPATINLQHATGSASEAGMSILPLIQHATFSIQHGAQRFPGIEEHGEIGRALPPGAPVKEMRKGGLKRAGTPGRAASLRQPVKEMRNRGLKRAGTSLLGHIFRVPLAGSPGGEPYLGPPA